MREIKLYDLELLCSDFGVNFSISASQNGYLIYHFGPVSWMKVIGDNLNWEDYVNINRRLAATFPEKVLG
jgi:hypothetical protein